MTDVVLVDGVGRPRIVHVIDPGDVLAFAHEGIKSGPESRVKFDRQFEAECNGLAVYRMRCPGPFPRVRIEYLRPDLPFNPPRGGTA